MVAKTKPHRSPRLALRVVAFAIFSSVLIGCQAPQNNRAYEPCSPTVARSAWVPPAVHANKKTVTSFDSLITSLSEYRVILIGEHHDRYDHHLTQLEVICRLHKQDPRLAIGIEFVQQPFQAALDHYVQRSLDEKAFLRDSEYFRRWGFDFRLYAPILRFAAEHAIPVIALNVPGEVTSKVASGGLDALTDAERELLGSLQPVADEHYRERLKEVFKAHTSRSSNDFENFLSAQLLWDEGMAARAARYLTSNGDIRLVVIAGNGHVAYRNALAERIEARHGEPVVVISQGQFAQSDPPNTLLDFYLRSNELSLPPAGKLGVILNTSEEGVKVGAFVTRSAAEAAGIQSGDFIVAIDDQPTATFSDVKLMLWNKTVGDTVRVGIQRDGEPLQFTLKLQ